MGVWRFEEYTKVKGAHIQAMVSFRTIDLHHVITASGAMRILYHLGVFVERYTPRAVIPIPSETSASDSS